MRSENEGEPERKKQNENSYNCYIVTKKDQQVEG